MRANLQMTWTTCVETGRGTFLKSIKPTGREFFKEVFPQNSPKLSSPRGPHIGRVPSQPVARGVVLDDNNPLSGAIRSRSKTDTHCAATRPHHLCEVAGRSVHWRFPAEVVSFTLRIPAGHRLCAFGNPPRKTAPTPVEVFSIPLISTMLKVSRSSKLVRILLGCHAQLFSKLKKIDTVSSPAHVVLCKSIQLELVEA